MSVPLRAKGMNAVVAKQQKDRMDGFVQQGAFICSCEEI